MVDKALNNKNTEDVKKTSKKVEVFGNPDEWVLICKASGDRWMKSTKRRKVENGYVWQVSTEFRDEKGNVTSCSESITFQKVSWFSKLFKK